MKKFTAILLVMLMLLSGGAVTAFAENGPSSATWDGSYYLAYISFYNYNTSTPVNYSVFRENTAHNSAIAGATYDRASNTLTLKDFNHPELNLETNMMGDDFRLEIKGSCALNSIAVWGYGYGGSLSVTGDGTLTLNERKTSNSAVYMYPEDTDFTLSFGDKVKVNLYAAKNVISVKAAKGTDFGSSIIFSDGKERSVSVTQASSEEYKTVSGYYYQQPVEDEKDYLGRLTTKKDDAEGVYGTSIYVDDDLNETGEYGISRYVYSKKYGFYFKDKSFGDVTLTADEMEQQGYEMKYEEKLRDYPEYLYNPVVAKRVRCKVYTDDDSNVYYVWDSGDVVDEIKNVVLNGEPVDGCEGEYLFSLNGEVDIDDLTETGSNVNGYYLVEGENDEEGDWLGEKTVCESDPEGIYAAREWYRTDDNENVTERGVTVYKYIYNEEIGFYMNDTSFSDNDYFNLYGSREMTVEEFEDTDYTIIYPLVKEYVYITNPYYSRSQSGSYFYVYADGEGKEYVVNTDYSVDEEVQVVLNMEEIDVLDGWYWLTLNESVSASDLAQVKEYKTLEGYYDYAVEGTELIYAPTNGETQPTEATQTTEATQPTEPEATQPTDTTEVTQPTDATEATHPTDVTEETQPTDAQSVKPVKKDISKCTVSGIKSKTYTGKAITQSVVVKDGSKTLKNGTDYSVTYKDNTKAGTATVTITGKGSYTGSVKQTFTIKKATNPLAVKTASKNIKASAVNKKAQSFTPSLINKKGQGTVSYKMGSNNSKVKKYFSINNKSGKITAKKNTPKGTYKVKVSVTAAGNGNYKKATKDATVTVRIK